MNSRSSKFSKSLVAKDVLIYLEDVAGHVTAMEQVANGFHEILNRAHSNYLAQISIELTEASNSMGITMKKFTAGATIFLPLTLIAGIMGMNVYVPGNVGGPNDHPAWFWVILAIMTVMSILLFWIGKKFKWFS